MRIENGLGAPLFRVLSMAGRSRGLEDYRGAPLVLHIWAPWLEGSGALLAEVEAFHRTVEGCRVVSLAMDARGPAASMALLRKASATHDILLDTSFILCRVWGLKDLPLTVVLDAKGTVSGIFERFPADAIGNSIAAPVEGRKGGDETRPATDLDIRVQACGIFLSRGKRKEAVDSLREALEMDPGNRIMEGQIRALEEGS